MATEQLKNKLKKQENRTFIARDFESLRAQLLDTARTYFPDKIQDFSEASVGGMFLDFAATVGDSLSFYLDHSFRELDPIRAVEPDNIIMHLQNAGVEIIGASPASVVLTFTMRVPATYDTALGRYIPKRNAMPIILAGTTVESFQGINFTTVNDIDFAEQDEEGRFIASYSVSNSTNGAPTHFSVTRDVLAVSGQITTENFQVPDTFVPFREFTLSEPSITSIISIRDAQSNTYYEVESLSEDTVFLKTKNQTSDAALSPNFISVIPAPYRFLKRYSPITQLTTLRFGGGNAKTLDDDIVPDPSELSLNLYGKPVVTKFNINPSSLLDSQTLGISPRGTTLTISYRFGGGLEHNVSSKSVETITGLSISFRRSPSAPDALSVRNSITVTNNAPASGGDVAPSLQELQGRITSAKKAQRRVVTAEDLLARIYTLPNEFGRVYRAAIYENPLNPGSALLYVLSRDRDGNLSLTPDAAKLNIRTYLNELRLVGDAIDILDGRVINFGVQYKVLLAENANKSQVLTNINSRLAQALDRRLFSIGQPIIIDDITNVIINTDFVLSLQSLQVHPIDQMREGRIYSTSTFNFSSSALSGIVHPRRGDIFELRYPDFDISGMAGGV